MLLQLLGAAIIISVTQLKTLFGIDSKDGDSFITKFIYDFSAIKSINWITSLTGILCAIFIIMFRYTPKKVQYIPSALVVIVVTTVVSWLAHFESHGVDIGMDSLFFDLLYQLLFNLLTLF